MGSSKVQCGLDWLFNNKHPCERKSQKQWLKMLVWRIGYKPLSFMRYHLSINYDFFLFISSYPVWLLIIIIISLPTLTPGSAIKVFWSEIAQFVMHWNLPGSQSLGIKHIIEVLLCLNFIHSHKAENRERVGTIVFQMKPKY